MRLFSDIARLVPHHMPIYLVKGASYLITPLDSDIDIVYTYPVICRYHALQKNIFSMDSHEYQREIAERKANYWRGFRAALLLMFPIVGVLMACTYVLANAVVN
jgi:hypothetical protein